MVEHKKKIVLSTKKKKAKHATSKQVAPKTVRPKRQGTKKVLRRPLASKTKKETTRAVLKKHHENPIVTPHKGSPWRSKATFNPSALHHDGMVHLVYRAMGDTDVSVLGYSQSQNGLSFTETSNEAVYAHQYSKGTKESASPIMYSSGGGWNGGCEDPRLTNINDRVYMTYTAFDGWGSVRVGLTSISLDDFVQNIWRWKEPVLISPPHEVHKNWVLFPEKIRGSYAILHAISPEICIDYIDDLDHFDGNTFIQSIHHGSSSWKLREPGIRGVGPSPIKTKDGWLVLYHKTETHDPHRYKIFAMLLDREDPKNIRYKSRGPILEPDAHYENSGHKPGIMYTCGAVVKDNTLFVYYGGADTVTCVATADLDAFLKELTTSGIARVTTQKK